MQRLTRADIQGLVVGKDENAATLRKPGYVRPAVASCQGNLIFKMSPGLFRFFTKGLLVRWVNV